MNIKKVVGIAVVVALVGTALYLNQPKTDKTEKPIVKIGMVYPFTGSMGHLGRDCAQSAHKVLDEANNNPNNTFHYQLIEEDDQMTPSKTITIANKFMSIDKVNLVLSSWSGPAMAIKPLMAQNNMIHFGCTYMQDLSDGKNTFNFSVTNKDLVEAAFNFVKEHKAKKVALLFQTVPAGAQILQMIEPKLKTDGIQYDEYLFQGTELDAFRTVVAKIKAKKYDMVLLYGWAPGISLAAREIKSQELNVPVLGFDTVETANYDFSYFDGIYEVGKPYNEEWEKMLKARHPDSVYMYDALRLIVQMFEKAGKDLGRVPSPDEFRQYMYSQRDYEGLIGHIHLSDEGLFQVPTFLKKIEGTNIKTIK